MLFKETQIDVEKFKYFNVNFKSMNYCSISKEQQKRLDELDWNIKQVWIRMAGEIIAMVRENRNIKLYTAKKQCNNVVSFLNALNQKEAYAAQSAVDMCISVQLPTAHLDPSKAAPNDHLIVSVKIKNEEKTFLCFGKFNSNLLRELIALKILSQDK